MKSIVIIIVTSLFLFTAWDRSGAWDIPKSESDWYLPVGINLGRSFSGESGGGFILGGEMSFTRLSESWYWAGIYGDALWDFEEGALRSSIGPQVGLFLIGIEAGYLLEYDDNGYCHGTRVGGVLTLGAVSAYFRWGHLFNHDGDSERFEAGALLKFPFN